MILIFFQMLIILIILIILMILIFFQMLIILVIFQIFQILIKLKSIQLCRKVYGILTLQLIVTIGIVAMFLKDQRLIELTVRHPELIYAAAGCMLTLMIVLICCDDCRRVWPANIIMLMLFTFCQGWLLATISVTYQVNFKQFHSFL